MGLPTPAYLICSIRPARHLLIGDPAGPIRRGVRSTDALADLSSQTGLFVAG